MTLVTFNANQSYMQLTSCISFIVLLLASLSSCNTHYYTGAQSDHFDGTRFYYQTNKTPVKNAFSILKWRFTRENISAPDNVPIQFSQANLPERIANRVSVTYIYHASFVIQTQNIWALNALVVKWFKQAQSSFVKEEHEFIQVKM